LISRTEHRGELSNKLRSPKKSSKIMASPEKASWSKTAVNQQLQKPARTRTFNFKNVHRQGIKTTAANPAVYPTREQGKLPCSARTCITSGSRMGAAGRKGAKKRLPLVFSEIGPHERESPSKGKTSEEWSRTIWDTWGSSVPLIAREAGLRTSSMSVRREEKGGSEMSVLGGSPAGAVKPVTMSPSIVKG